MKSIILILLLSFSQISLSEIHKEARFCKESGELCFYWWPVLTDIEGWHQDLDISYRFKTNMQVPIGSSFSKAETIIYAKAVFTERQPESKNLSEFIANDHARFKGGEDEIKVTPSAPLKTKNGITFPTYEFTPLKNGNWERVAYGEDTDEDGNKYYLTIVVSSKSFESLNKTMGVYEKFVSNYK